MFHVLLLTVLGSQSDYHGCRTPRCAYVLVVKTRSMGRFCPISWTITQFWGPEMISIVVEPRGAFTCQSATHTIVANSGPSLGLLLTVLWSQSDFHGCRTPRYAYVLVVKTRSLVDSGPFLGLLLSFVVLK